MSELSYFESFKLFLKNFTTLSCCTVSEMDNDYVNLIAYGYGMLEKGKKASKLAGNVPLQEITKLKRTLFAAFGTLFKLGKKEAIDA